MSRNSSGGGVGSRTWAPVMISGRCSGRPESRSPNNTSTRSAVPTTMIEGVRPAPATTVTSGTKSTPSARRSKRRAPSASGTGSLCAGSPAPRLARVRSAVPRRNDAGKIGGRPGEGRGVRETARQREHPSGPESEHHETVALDDAPRLVRMRSQTGQDAGSNRQGGVGEDGAIAAHELAPSLSRTAVTHCAIPPVSRW